MSVRNSLDGNCTIAREFEYVDARGREQSLLVEIEIYVNRGYAASRNEPREPAYAEFVVAHYRDDKGRWVVVKDDEWLASWVRDEFELLDETTLHEAMGEAF